MTKILKMSMVVKFVIIKYHNKKERRKPNAPPTKNNFNLTYW